MKKLLNVNRIRQITFSLLFVLIFAFFHSELGQFSVKGDNHESHSFSILISGAVAQNFKILDHDHFKLQIDKVIFIHTDEILHSLITSLDVFVQNIKPPQKRLTYLLNHTFLI